MSNSCTVCVRGYPTNLAPERVADKLMIHFLRARNGGGEISNIEFAPETSDCAMITFEDAAVAQRVLKAKKHVLSVSGENYPLEVAASPTKLNPDQIFVYVHMKIDYGSFPKGQEVLCCLFMQYKGIHFSFNSQKMICSVKGTFTELQAFSSELLRSLTSKQRGSISEVNRRRPAARDVASQQVETEEENKEAVGGPLSIQNSLDNLKEPLEDFSLVIDSDIYLYMQRFCGEELSKILNHSQVGVVDVNSEGVTTLYLQATLDGDEAMRALVSVRRAISRLSEQLEATLRKEKISKNDLGADGLRSLPGELQSLYPQVLCHEDHEHIYLIGDLMDVSVAKQHAEKFIAARGMSQDCQKDDALQPSHLPVIHKRSAVPGQLKSSEDTGPIKMNSPEPSGKTGHKLAAKFNSNPSLPSLSSLGAPSVRKFPGSLPADYQPPNSELQFLEVAASEFKSQTGEYQKAPQGVKINPPHAMPGGTVSRSEGFTSLPFKGPSSLDVDPSALRSLKLLDTTGAVDCQQPEPRPLLKGSQSFLWQEPRYSSESMSELQQLEAQDSVSHLPKKAQEKIPPTLQKEVSQEKMTQKEKTCEVESQNAEQRPTNFHLFAMQRDDGRLLGTPRVENLAKFPDYIYESFSYSELGMEGPEDAALTGLCNYLKGCQNEVLISRDRYKLELAYPCEAKVKILEALKVYFIQRKATLDKQLLSHEVQHRGIVDMSSTESQSIQPVKESSKTSWRESSPISGSPAGRKLPSQVQQLLEDSAAQRLLVQGFANDREAGQSKSLSQIPDASKQGLLGKLVAEGLPSELHFVQDRSKEECSGETEMAPRSRPLLLPSASDLVPLQEPVKCYPPAVEAVASDLHQRAANPERETHNGECQVSRSGPATLSHTPCYQTLGRTSCSVGNTSSSNVCPSVISGTFTVAVLSQSLPGYYRYPTLKLIYDIPDGVQQMGHPRPGHLYRGGRFEAYLPDIPEGRQLMVLLREAFERDLTFQIQSCASEERVTWGTLPHKTAMEKGKDRTTFMADRHEDCQYSELDKALEEEKITVSYKDPCVTGSVL